MRAFLELLDDPEHRETVGRVLGPLAAMDADALRELASALSLAHARGCVHVDGGFGLHAADLADRLKALTWACIRTENKLHPRDGINSWRGKKEE